MEILAFISILICVSYFCYMLIGGSDKDLLRRRLNQISSEGYKEKKSNKSSEISKSIILILKPMLKKISGKTKDRKTLKHLMTEAGMSSGDDDLMKFVASRFLKMFFGLLFGLVLMVLMKFNPNSLMIAVSLAIMGYILPIFALKSKAKHRASEITYNLPDALDLLTVCVEAGLGLDASLSRVAKEFSRTSEILSSELERVSKDILAGIPRQDAFRNLASRNNVQDLQSLTALLIQTDKLGTSIAQSLRVYCDTVRTRRRQRVEGLAQKASVKMIIPLVIFILPAMFVVILAPAAISLSQNMK